MESMTIIVGLISIMLVLFIVNFWLRDRHTLLQFFFITIILSLSILIPKALLDNQECNYVAMNETTAGDTTSFEYDLKCYSSDNATALIFYKVIMGVIVVFWTYVFLYFQYIIWIENLFKKWGIINPKQTKLKGGRKL